MIAAFPDDDGTVPTNVVEFPTVHPETEYIVDYAALLGPIVLDYVNVFYDIANREKPLRHHIILHARLPLPSEPIHTLLRMFPYA